MINKKRKVLIKKCPTCLKEYKTKRVSQKYCTAECHYKNKERNRQISKAQKEQKDKIKRKRISTLKQKYGVTHNSQIEDVKISKREKSLKKYGVPNPLCSKEVIENNKLIMLEKYGVDNPSKSIDILEKKWSRFKKKYGEAHPYLVEEFYKKMRGSLGGKTKPEEWLCTYFKENNIEYFYDYPVVYETLKKRYDFYLPEFNLLVEFDGEYWHKQSLEECDYEWQKANFKNDLLKNKIAKELGYKLVRIKGSINLMKKWEWI